MKKIIFCLFFILIISCKEKDVLLNKPSKILDISKQKRTKDSFRKYVSSFRFIELKGMNSIDFINKVDKIEYLDSEYFVLDKSKSNLLVFDLKGNYVRKIGKRGNGPGEYKNISDFVINKKKKTVTLLSSNNIGYFIFNTKGEYIKKARFSNFYPKRIGLINDDTYVMYTSYASNYNKDLIFTNLNGKIVDKKFDYPEGIDQMAFNFSGGIKSINDKTFYTQVASSKIYELDVNLKAYVKYQVEFVNKTWSEDKKFELFKFSRETKKMNLSYLGNSYFENENIFLFDFTDKNKEKKGFYNIKNELLYTSDSFNNDGILRVFDNVVGLSERNLFYSVFNPQYYNPIKKYFKGFESEIKKLNKEFHKILSEKKDESNQYLLIYKLNLDEK
ncbi:hypothetical protein KCTC32516_00394 [Polaribacter huanghezhanensis]|uniref:6-bladed beta-propeller n=1 Tax=Polaribacter huanghezhanensis TaxID=1354726 RepID=UPI0026482CA4|nr:6-bladed beta-propeller [Polaribacter huanghezhanensis]WKD85056.1 hypothetical protein KCTC32516_00394 [Polaribacter huanghezhanensis]